MFPFCPLSTKYHVVDVIVKHKGGTNGQNNRISISSRTTSTNRQVQKFKYIHKSMISRILGMVNTLTLV